MHYSAAENAFFPDDLRNVYESAKTWPDDAVEIDDDEYRAYSGGGAPDGMQLGSDENGRPTWVPIPPPDLDTLAARKRAKIDTARDTALQAGLSFTMPDGTQETVQTRAQDEPNLLGLAIEARDLKAEGVTDPVLTLRAESNRNYQLTPQQMIELTDAAKNHKKQVLATSWQLKDAVDEALKNEDRDAIEAIKWPDDPT